MNVSCRLARVVAALVVVLSAVSAFAAVPPPREVLGMEIGANRVLASWSDTERYARALARASDRVKVLEMGQTVEGRTMLALAISTPDNLKRLDELRAGWSRLADPRGLAAAERDRLVRTLPACALITAGIHATEVASTQTALLFAYRLAAAPADSEEARRLEHVVVVLVPSMNPDGQEHVVEWYRRWLGTPYEGSQPPFLYHRYAGHDNNRDFVYLTQPESRALNRLAYLELHPQLFLDLHQMGPAGPRQFVPPFADPVSPSVNPLVWRVTSHLGTLLALRLEEDGKAGVVSGWTFDGNWIGGTRNTGWWKNVFGILTETASAALATPITVDEGELKGGGKGLVDYRQQVNFPNPWRGGTWGLADAVSYQLDLVGAFVEFAATHRADLLRDVATMAGDAVALGTREGVRAWIVPPSDNDPSRSRRLVELLVEAGAEALMAPHGCTAGGIHYPPGTVVFDAAQPLRQYLVEVLGRQHYPEISPAPDADILLPYDVTAWSMPLGLGAEVVESASRPEGDLTRLAGPDRLPGTKLAGKGSALLVPSGQLDGYLVANRALERGAQVSRLEAAGTAGGRVFPAGSFVVRGLDRKGVDAVLAGTAVTAALAEPPAAGTTTLRRATIGVYHPDFGLEDAGWLRFVLERAGFPVEVVDNRAVASGGFAGKVDVLVLPPLEGKVLLEGSQRPAVVPPPPEFRKGIGRDGIESIRRFFAGGGTVLAFQGSADWLAETLDLPVSNALRGVSSEHFLAPGSLVALEIDPASGVGLGMPPHVAAMLEGAFAFQTRPVGGDVTREVAARFPDGPVLESGFVRGEERLRRRVAVVEVRRERGRAVLYSLAPYFRGQTEATFPLLFNAVLEAMADPPRQPAASAGGKS